ncbi:MAG: ferrous iron transport protein A [Saprospiraceae bacterium]|nr:ferrous iron transport protein A [Saprospiraceae bacterium]
MRRVIDLSLHNIKEGQHARVIKIKGSDNYQLFLLSLGLKTGTRFTYNYSPGFTKLVNISIGGKMVALRRSEFELIEFKVEDNA